MIKQEEFKKAAFNNDFKKVALLLKNKDVVPTENNNFVIGQVAEFGNYQVLKVLMKDKRIDPSDDNNYAICLASCGGLIDIVELLLTDKRVDPSEDDNYSIRVASMEGFTEVVELLLTDKRVDPSDHDNICIMHSMNNMHNNDYVDIVALLWKDKRVRKKLQENNPNEYMELMKPIVKNKISDF